MGWEMCDSKSTYSCVLSNIATKWKRGWQVTLLPCFRRHLSTLRICIRTSFISEKQWGFYQNQVYQTHFCSRLQTQCSTAITRITLHCKQLIVAGWGGGFVFRRRRELGRQDSQNNTVLVGLSQERMLRLLGTAECVPVLPMPLFPWGKADDKCVRRSRWKILQAHYANDRCPKSYTKCLLSSLKVKYR